MYKIVAVILGIVALGLVWSTHSNAAFHGPVIKSEGMERYYYESNEDIEELIDTFEKSPNVIILEIHTPFESYDGRMEILVQGDGFQNYNWITWKQGMLCEVIKDTTRTKES